MKRKLLTAGAALAIIMSCGSMKTSNQLLTDSKAPFGAPEFDKIKNEHYLPAFEAGIAEAKAEIDAIVANPEEPTFENTIEAMEFSGRTLNKVAGIFFNLRLNFAGRQALIADLNTGELFKVLAGGCDIFLFAGTINNELALCLCRFDESLIVCKVGVSSSADTQRKHHDKCQQYR
jgi:hypothetical protein